MISIGMCSLGLGPNEQDRLKKGGTPVYNARSFSLCPVYSGKKQHRYSRQIHCKNMRRLSRISLIKLAMCSQWNEWNFHSVRGVTKAISFVISLIINFWLTCDTSFLLDAIRWRKKLKLKLISKKQKKIDMSKNDKNVSNNH